jgi:hypothetical protein
MKLNLSLHAVFILFCCQVLPAIGHAQDQVTGFQASLFHPKQLHPDTYSVDGFRINIIYGVSEDMQGIDIGIVNESTGSVHGFELGLDNRVGKDFGGSQLGLFNEVKEDCKGLQVGVIVNLTRGEMQGVQIGLYNHAESLDGIQLGLFNFNDDTKYLGFFPFINAAF